MITDERLREMVLMFPHIEEDRLDFSIREIETLCREVQAARRLFLDLWMSGMIPGRPSYMDSLDAYNKFQSGEKEG